VNLNSVVIMYYLYCPYIPSITIYLSKISS